MPLLFVTVLETRTSSLPLTELEEPGCELWEAREDAPKRDALGPGVDGSLSIVPANAAVEMGRAIEPYSRRRHRKLAVGIGDEEMEAGRQEDENLGGVQSRSEKQVQPAIST